MLKELTCRMCHSCEHSGLGWAASGAGELFRSLEEEARNGPGVDV